MGKSTGDRAGLVLPRRRRVRIRTRSNTAPGTTVGVARQYERNLRICCWLSRLLARPSSSLVEIVPAPMAFREKLCPIQSGALSPKRTASEISAKPGRHQSCARERETPPARGLSHGYDDSSWIVVTCDRRRSKTRVDLDRRLHGGCYVKSFSVVETHVLEPTAAQECYLILKSSDAIPVLGTICDRTPAAGTVCSPVPFLACYAYRCTAVAVTAQRGTWVAALQPRPKGISRLLAP